MKKFNTFNGVFIPSYEAILGAVLFLVLPFLVAGMGLTKMLVIVLIANSATIATAFSITDCTSNLLHVDSGGMFAVSKRSLGRAFGGAIGIQLFLAQALSIGFYVIGFAKSLQIVLVRIPSVAQFFSGLDMDSNLQLQLMAMILGLLVFCIALIGTDFIVRIQIVIFIILSISVASILLSPILIHNEAQLFNELFSEGLNVNGVGLSIGFWGAFAMFFPAVTGIDAGIGMSGQLKNPHRALSRGTFLAITVTGAIYMLLTIVFSMIAPGKLISPGEVPVSSLTVFQSHPPLYFFILTGIFFATGSSSLSYFMTAPRTLQSLASERLLPHSLNFLKYNFRGRSGEPQWATLCTFLLFMPIIIASNIQFASTAVGISFLTVYGWVNLAAFMERISGNPSFRPTSKGHWLISLYGFIICMLGIVLFNLLIGLGVIMFQSIVFALLLRYRSEKKLEGVWWGVLFKMVQWIFSRMSAIIQGTKNWRPIMKTFACSDRPELLRKILDMADQISRYKGLTMVNIFSFEKSPLAKNFIRLQPDEVDSAILSISQSALPGKFQTNTILLPVDKRINLMRVTKELIAQEKHVLIYQNGAETSQEISQTISKAPLVYRSDAATDSYKPGIDIWWKGEDNGNLMALLAYIITRSETKFWQGRRPADLTIRFIRKLYLGETTERAKNELSDLMHNSRLNGDIVILPADNDSIQNTVRKHSQDSILVMLGMPGEQANGIQRMFAIEEMLFSKHLKVYDGMPPMLFVKAFGIISLNE